MGCLSEDTFSGQSGPVCRFCLEHRRFDRSHRDTESSRNFVVGNLLEKMERYHFPLSLWERPDRINEATIFLVLDNGSIHSREMFWLAQRLSLGDGLGRTEVPGLCHPRKNRVSPGQEGRA